MPEAGIALFFGEKKLACMPVWAEPLLMICIYSGYGLGISCILQGA
jgi:membrane-associated PAP2 superfamily phosphatase